MREAAEGGKRVVLERRGEGERVHCRWSAEK